MDWADRVNESNAAEQAMLDRFALLPENRTRAAVAEQDRTLEDTCEVEGTCAECQLPLRRNKATGYSFPSVTGDDGRAYCSALCSHGGTYNPEQQEDSCEA